MLFGPILIIGMYSPGRSHFLQSVSYGSQHIRLREKSISAPFTTSMVCWSPSSWTTASALISPVNFVEQLSSQYSPLCSLTVVFASNFVRRSSYPIRVVQTWLQVPFCSTYSHCAAHSGWLKMFLKLHKTH